jgi:branched-subunit amino acid transport protein
MTTIWIIFGMAVVTALPRLLPALFLDEFDFPTWLEKWLKSIPYAALGALIFPGVLLVAEDEPLLGVAGGLVALILSCLGLHLIFGMVGSILVVILLQHLL